MKRNILSACLFVAGTFFVTAQDREVGNAEDRMTTLLAAGTPSITYANMFATRALPILGWNWDNPISQYNDLVFGHTLHIGYRWTWTNANGLNPGMGTRMRDSSTADPDQTVWLYPHVSGPNGELAENAAGGSEEVKCLKYDPEITVSLTNFIPTANASPGAVFGFRYKDANVTNATTRVLLEAADFPDDDTTLVLADVWPDSAMMQRFQDNVPKPRDYEKDRSGRQILLSVNLRRAAGASTTQDTMPVAILRLKYHTFADAQGAIDSGYVIFDSVPNPNNVVQLNENDPSYGTTCGFFRLGDTSTTLFIIRRHHLPVSGDINLSAWINFPYEFTEPLGINPPLTHLWGIHGSHTENFIRTLDVEVNYITNAADTSDTDIEIDWIKLETPHARDYLSGRDSALFVDSHVAFLQDLNRFNTLANRQFRVDSWYARDEANMMYWEGWRHYNRLVDSNAVSETDGDYARHLLHKVGTPRLWQGATGGPTNSAVPYYRFGYIDGNPLAPNDFLGYRLGTEMQEEHWPQQHEGETAQFVNVDFDTHWGDKPSQSEPGKFSVELPMPDSLYDNVVVSANLYSWGTSPLSTIEAYLWRYYVRPDHLFQHQVPWIANIWAYGYWTQRDTARNAVIQEQRVPTGSEVYLHSFEQLALGAKGLMTFYCISRFQRVQPLPPTSPDIGDISMGLTSLSSVNLGIQTIPGTRGYDFIRDPDLGTDFFDADTANEPTRLTYYFLDDNGDVNLD